MHVTIWGAMELVARLREAIPEEVFDYRTLMCLLDDYSKPRDAVGRLVRSGALVRIRQGLYCFAPAFRRREIPRPCLANLVYGPSYVSLEYALAYWGLIPERVHLVTSVSIGRSRSFETPLGGFSYRMLKLCRYSPGFMRVTEEGSPFLIATPEKALADKVWTDSRFPGDTISSYGAYLHDDLRIAGEDLARLDLSILAAIAHAYDSRKLRNLSSYMAGEVSRHA
ncbi:MAG: hypothetical protein R6U36_06135 [Candidatus Fermentibacteraceae bacterium]